MIISVADFMHPEAVLGRRGHPYHIDMYQKDLQKINHTARGWEVPSYLMQGDAGTRHHMTMCKKFQVEKPSIYSIGKNFCSVLSSIQGDIPFNKLPDRFFGYIHFPRKTIYDEDGEVFGAYVFIGSSRETTLNPNLPDERSVWINYISEGKSGVEYDFSMSYVLMEASKSFEESRKGIESSPTRTYQGHVPVTPEINKIRNKVYKCIINTVIYIHSADPEISKLRPLYNRSHSERKKSGDLRNISTVPVMAINWNYQKPFVRHMDKTWRNEHFRWQPCGPERSQVKLTMVKGHEMHFKREKECTITQA